MSTLRCPNSPALLVALPQMMASMGGAVPLTAAAAAVMDASPDAKRRSALPPKYVHVNLLAELVASKWHSTVLLEALKVELSTGMLDALTHFVEEMHGLACLSDGILLNLENMTNLRRCLDTVKATMKAAVGLQRAVVTPVLINAIVKAYLASLKVQDGRAVHHAPPLDASHKALMTTTGSSPSGRLSIRPVSSNLSPPPVVVLPVAPSSASTDSLKAAFEVSLLCLKIMTVMVATTEDAAEYVTPNTATSTLST
ncbi:hypothetical protein EON66_00940 [archaeon]|nr:MAG: hypothetical protein EON66_00940 [archaeon]